MLKKILILFLFFYFLVLLQTSFFVHFSMFNLMPNFVLIAMILWNLIERAKSYFGIFLGFWAGFFLDVFSSNFIGFYILILIALAFLIKITLRRYVRSPLG